MFLFQLIKHLYVMFISFLIMILIVYIIWSVAYGVGYFVINVIEVNTAMSINDQYSYIGGAVIILVIAGFFTVNYVYNILNSE